MDETAQKIKSALKEAGFSRKQITVRHKRCLYDDSYRVTIHDPDVSVLEIEDIANKFQHIRYDEYCGEILNGCNRYVDVERHSEKSVDISPILPEVREALKNALKTAANQKIELATRSYLIGMEQQNNPNLWGQNPEYMNRLTGKSNYESEFDFLCSFFYIADEKDRFFESTVQNIASRIVENELNIAYIIREAKKNNPEVK